MSFDFRPARREQAGLFVALAGGTNSGKTFSGLRLARGIAGPAGKIAAVDTEAGRMSHYAKDFAFDVVNMQPPFRPERFAQAAIAAEEAGYAVLLIDSFSMEWVGPGGVLDWQAEEYQRMGSREAVKLASWIKPKMGHKAMIYSFLQRRIPIVFALRAEEKAEKAGDKILKRWEPICNKQFPFEITVSFMLSASAKGVIDLDMPWKMEKDHQGIFHNGDLISEEHGAKLAAWASGDAVTAPPTDKPRRTFSSVLTEVKERLAAARTEADVDEVLASDDAELLTTKGSDAVTAELNAAVQAAMARVWKPEFAPAGEAA